MLRVCMGQQQRRARLGSAFNLSASSRQRVLLQQRKRGNGAAIIY